MKKTLTPIWAEIPGFGYRKTIINAHGEHLYTYHSGSKTAEPSIVIIWNTKKAKKLLGFIAIEKDLNDTLIFLEEFSNLTEAIDSAEYGSIVYNNKTILLKAILRSIVITYGRCFVKADGRGTKLETGDIGFDSRFIGFHDYIMSMRHQYVAHAGKSEHEEFKMVCPLSTTTEGNLMYSTNTPLLTEGNQLIGYDSFTYEYTQILNDVLAYVRKKIEKHQNVVLDEIIVSSDELTRLLQANRGKERIVYNGPTLRHA
jgi:hypothetical protein